MDPGYHLFMPTTGEAPAQDFSSWIPLLVSFEQKDRVKVLGARWNRIAGVWMWPLNKPRAHVREWLPLCYRDDLEPPYLKPDMVPESMWGENLRKYLGDSEWKRVSRECRRRTSGFCRICGVHNKPHCHEQWEFIPDPSGARRGVQKLTGLVCLCEDCHRAIHVGKASVDGRLDEALSHLANVNNWTAEEAQASYHQAGEEWEWRNQYRWTLDCSLVEREYGVTADIAASEPEKQNVSVQVEEVEFGEAGETLDLRHYFEPLRYPDPRPEPEEYQAPRYVPVAPPALSPPLYRAAPVPAIYAPQPKRRVRFRTLLFAMIAGLLVGRWLALKYILKQPHIGTINAGSAKAVTNAAASQQKKGHKVRRRHQGAGSQIQAGQEKSPGG
jgi:Domain of unknown function (DUF5710)